jgi:SSS family solute:Na+ symporter
MKFQKTLTLTFLVVNWAGGWFNGWEKALATKPELFEFPGEGVGTYFTLQLLWTFGWILTPHMWQRVLMARSPKVLGKSMVIATPISLWVVTFCGAVIGFLAMGMIPQLPAGTDADSILALLYSEYLPVGVVFLATATFAAGMSTVDSQLLSSSSTFTIDIYQPLNKQNVSEQKVQSVGKMFIAVFVLSVMLLTLSSLGRSLLTTLASLGVGYALQFLPCLVGMIYWKKATKTAVFWGLLLGFIFMNLVEFTALGTGLPGSFGGAFWGLLVNVVVFVVLSYTTKPVDQKQVDDFHGYLKEIFSQNEEDTFDQLINNRLEK